RSARGDQPRFVGVWDVDGDVKAGRGAADARLGQRGGERIDQRVAAAAVGPGAAADVPVVGAAGDEVGEGVLFEGGDAVVEAFARLQQWAMPGGWGDQPAQPQGRGERFGDRADVGHEVRSQALQRADRGAVVAVLGVVVVLDDQRVVL